LFDLCEVDFGVFNDVSRLSVTGHIWAAGYAKAAVKAGYEKQKADNLKRVVRADKKEDKINHKQMKELTIALEENNHKKKK